MKTWKNQFMIDGYMFVKKKAPLLLALGLSVTAPVLASDFRGTDTASFTSQASENSLEERKSSILKSAREALQSQSTQESEGGFTSIYPFTEEEMELGFVSSLEETAEEAVAEAVEEAVVEAVEEEKEETEEETKEETKEEPAQEQETSEYTGPVLNPFNGTIMGPSGKETYYNLDMSGVISIMRSMGNTDEYWVREDGVKMLGDYIMCAANLDVHPRGSLVESSLGTCIVCDTGGFAYENAYQLDIAVTW